MPAPPAAATLQKEFPGWTLWLSGTGRWWASRRKELTAAEVTAGCVLVLHADDSDELVRQLRAQEACACAQPEQHSIQSSPPGDRGLTDQ